ncbi:unnamed protein product [Ixodes hexagonus]
MAVSLLSCRGIRHRIIWFLLLCGDIASNPGPRPLSSRPTCCRCERVVYDNVAALQCDGCGRWVHRKCEFMSLPVYRRLSTSIECWFCGACQLPPFHDSLFEPPRSPSPHTPSQPTTPLALSSPVTGPVAPRYNNRRPRNHLNIWYSNVRSV